MLFDNLARTTSACIAFNVIWWIWFDVLLNVARKQAVFYVGSGGIDLTVKRYAKKMNWNAQDLMVLCKLIVSLLVIVQLIFVF